MVFLIMSDEYNPSSTEVNPSAIAQQLRSPLHSPSPADITRRRIYDIVHVMNCLDLLRRYSYRIYNWEGIASMQRLLTRLYSTPVRHQCRHHT